jgi:TonB family protein
MTWWQYLLLVNTYLVLFYGFYVLLLHKETFFQLNRVYLVSSVLLALFIPAIKADCVKDLFVTQRIHQTIYHLNAVNIYAYSPQQDKGISIGQIIAAIYFTGIALLSAQLIIQIILLRKKISKPAKGAAFSFFHQIKLGDDLNNRDIIMAHESVHAQQWHSADVLLIEIMMIFNWFNPVVYLYRRAFKHIHEFIADKKAVSAGTSKADYAMLLFSQTFKRPEHHLVNPFFNHSLLKQRIIMLQKNPSQRIKLLKYGLSAPLFALMLILSSAMVNTSDVIKIVDKKVQQVFAATTNSTTESGVATVRNKEITSASQPGIAELQSGEQQANQPLAASASTLDLAKKPLATEGPIFTSVETQPTFPDGIDAFYTFLGRHIRYPAAMRENNIQGRVIVTFVIEKDGSLSNIRSLRDLGYGSVEETIRVLKMSPKWIPGNQNGRPVRVQYTVPIYFQLDQSPITTATDSLRIKSTPAQKQPLYIVDGREATQQDFKDMKAGTIQTVDVLNSDKGTRLYGDKAANGVVVITIKH